MISLAEHNPELVKEWDYDLNNKDNIKPETVSYGSARKVWWKCPKGHSYLMGLNSRTCQGKKRQECSICSGRQILEGYNDFKSNYPDLMKEWNYEKNNKLSIYPNDIACSSHIKVWWKCGNNHEWIAPVDRRTINNSGCPFCSNQKLLIGYNDFASKYPDIAKEFNVLKNKKAPNEYLYGSSNKVWWICSKCGYEWKTSIINRTGLHQTGCPNCAPKLNRENQLKNQIKTSGSLFDNYTDLMKEWNYEKNDKNPKDIVPGSEYRAWWKCSKCNSEWDAIVVSRTRNGTGCPVCGSKKVVTGINDIKTLYPELMKEWDYDKNNKLGLDPKKLIKRSEKKAWWICPICNESYQTQIKNRTQGCNCPRCANELRTSFPEQAIFYYLKKYFNVINRWNDLGKEADIFIPELNLAIEYDGLYYHSSNDSLEREEDKYAFFFNNGIGLIRIKEGYPTDISFANYTIYVNGKNYDKDIIDIFDQIQIYLEHEYNFKIDFDVDISRDRQDIYSQYILQKRSNSIVNLHPELLKEWDYEKNKIDPYSIVPGSEKKVWWKCLKGHSYEQQVSNHVKGARCPYCSGLKVLKGENDLATKYPEIAKEWDYEKNALKPSEIKYGSSKKVWWKCPKGHSYEASISHRTGRKNEKCPICCNKKILKGYNDLKTIRPDLMKEWDYDKNIIDPENISCGSQKKAWWICPKGHSYDSVIHSRANSNTGCPICNGKRVLEGYNDFLSQQPELMKDWNYEKNDNLGIYPNQIHYHAWKKVWWKCSKCNYEWEAMPGKRSEGTGCPKCSLKK